MTKHPLHNAEKLRPNGRCDLCLNLVILERIGSAGMQVHIYIYTYIRIYSEENQMEKDLENEMGTVQLVQCS